MCQKCANSESCSINYLLKRESIGFEDLKKILPTGDIEFLENIIQKNTSINTMDDGSTIYCAKQIHDMEDFVERKAKLKKAIKTTEHKLFLYKNELKRMTENSQQILSSKVNPSTFVDGIDDELSINKCNCTRDKSSETIENKDGYQEIFIENSLSSLKPFTLTSTICNSSPVGLPDETITLKGDYTGASKKYVKKQIKKSQRKIRNEIQEFLSKYDRLCFEDQLPYFDTMEDFEDHVKEMIIDILGFTGHESNYSTFMDYVKHCVINQEIQKIDGLQCLNDSTLRSIISEEIKNVITKHLRKYLLVSNGVISSI